MYLSTQSNAFCLSIKHAKILLFSENLILIMDVIVYW